MLSILLFSRLLFPGLGTHFDGPGDSYQHQRRAYQLRSTLASKQSTSPTQEIGRWHEKVYQIINNISAVLKEEQVVRGLALDCGCLVAWV